MSVVCGSQYSLFLGEEGDVWSIGSNSYGNLGKGDTEDTNLPEKILFLPQVKMISAGQVHSLFLGFDGFVWSCGWNEFGQLGLNHQITTSKPERIESISEIISITAVYNHSFFIDKNYNVLGCGWNHFGQLGIADADSILLPTPIPNLPQVSVATGGYYHSIFIDLEGSVWGSGSNYKFQLGSLKCGLNRKVCKLNDIPKEVVTASGGEDHSIFFDVEGQVWVCGDNRSHQLGLPGANNAYAKLPFALSGLPPIQAVEAGGSYCMLLDTAGTVWYLGNHHPSSISPLENMPFIQKISAGHGHCYAIDIEDNIHGFRRTNKQGPNTSAFISHKIDLPVKLKSHSYGKKSTKSARNVL